MVSQIFWALFLPALLGWIMGYTRSYLGYSGFVITGVGVVILGLFFCIIPSLMTWESLRINEILSFALTMGLVIFGRITYDVVQAIRKGNYSN